MFKGLEFQRVRVLWVRVFDGEVIRWLGCLRVNSRGKTVHSMNGLVLNASEDTDTQIGNR